MLCIEKKKYGEKTFAHINPWDRIKSTSAVVLFKSFLYSVPSAAQDTITLSFIGEKFAQNILLLWPVRRVCFKVELSA